MNRIPFLSGNGSQDQGVWGDGTLEGQTFRREKGFFAWWYKHTAPPDVGTQATFERSDRIRRGRIASWLILFLLVTLVLEGAVAAFTGNRIIFTIILPVLAVTIYSIFVNRSGWVNWAGFLLAAVLAGSTYMSILIAPVSLSPTSVQVFLMLVLSDIIFVCIFPLKYGWIPAVINTFFTICTLVFVHHLAVPAGLLSVSYFPTVFSIALIHIVATGIPMILVSTMWQLIRRADKAEEMERLQYMLKQQVNEQLMEKEELESSIRKIIAVHVRVSNGDLDARVNIDGTKPLSNIADPLNTLLERYQQTRQTEIQWEQFSAHLSQWKETERALKQMQKGYLHFAEAVNRAIQEQQPFYCEKTATPLDAVIQEMNGRYLVQGRETSQMRSLAEESATMPALMRVRKMKH